MTELTSWPAGVDDSGEGQDGTVLTAAYYSAQKAAIEALIHSATNPAQSPAQTTDEVIAARGSLVSLDARLSAVVGGDGTPVAQAGQATIAQLQGAVIGRNLVANGDFQLWPDGDAAAPYYWTKQGAGSAVARTGNGLADTKQKVGDFAAKLTRAGTDCRLDHKIVPSGATFTRCAWARSMWLPIGAWVWCDTPNVALISVYDGATTTSSAYHTGDSSWRFLAVTHPISASASELTLRCEVRNTNVAGWFSGASGMIINTSGVVLSTHMLPITIYGTLSFDFIGTLVAGTHQRRRALRQAGIAKDLQVWCKTAPTGQAAIIDVNTWDGAALTSMFSSPPQVAAGAFGVNAQPAGTYARRCLRPFFGPTPGAGDPGSLVTVDWDQVGSGAPGADATVDIGVMVYERPLQAFLAHNE